MMPQMEYHLRSDFAEKAQTPAQGFTGIGVPREQEVLFVTTRKMRVGPSELACRSRLQPP